MLTLIPTLEGALFDPTTVLGVSLHADGALSRRQPGAVKHGLGVMVGSRNWS